MQEGAICSTGVTGLDQLVWHHLLFRLRCTERASLPPFLGSTLRGAFGHSLRWLSCTPRVKHCASCPIRKRCAYLYVFETPVPEGDDRFPGRDRLPHPFVIVPPPHHEGDWMPGEILEVGLIVIGRAVEHFSKLVLAFDWIADTGLGADRRRFEMEEVWSRHPDRPHDLLLLRDRRRFQGDPVAWRLDDLRFGKAFPPAVEVRFLSPVQLKAGGRPAGPENFGALAGSLLRRMTTLLRAHCGVEPEADFVDLSCRARQVETLDHDLRQVRLGRYSSRQGRALDQWGLVGSAWYEGEALLDFLPLLRLGEVLGVGKGSSWGMGRFEWRPLYPATPGEEGP